MWLTQLASDSLTADIIAWLLLSSFMTMLVAVGGFLMTIAFALPIVITIVIALAALSVFMWFLAQVWHILGPSIAWIAAVFAGLLAAVYVMFRFAVRVGIIVGFFYLLYKGVGWYFAK